MRLRFSSALTIAVLASFGLPGLAWGADLTEVTTAFEKGNPYDFRFKVSYEALIERTALNREYMGNMTGIDVVKDLIFRQVTHRLNLRAEFALYKDFGIYLSLPIILSQQATYGFASGSRYVGYSGESQCRQLEHPQEPWLCNPDGVNSQNSRFVQDGLVAGLSGYELVQDPGTGAYSLSIPSDYQVAAGTAGPRTLWEGQNRSGLDQLHLGIQGLIMSERRHPSYPTWLFGVEFRIAVGQVKDFERDAQGDPEGCSAPSLNQWNCRPRLNKAVGRGVHEVRFFTSVSKMSKLWENGGIDAFFHLWYQMPIAYLRSSFYSSRYDFSGQFGEENKSPLIKAPMKGGVSFGGEFVIWSDPVKKHRIAIELTGLVEGQFEGRDYSQAYELMAGAPGLNMDCTDPDYALFCGNTKLRDRMFYYPGVSTVENFMRLGLRVGIHAQFTKWVKFQILYAVVHEQEHFLTMDDAGIDNQDGPSPSAGGVCDSSVGCHNYRVDIGTTEQNPWHRPVVDQAGHRIRAQETLIHYITVSLKLMF